MTEIIGRSIGETETGSLEFISKKLSAIGEYVCIDYNDMTVLGMITAVNRGSLTIDSDIRNPDLVEKIHALEGDLEHYVRGYIMILGDIHTLKIPRTPAPPGIAIRKATKEELEIVFQKPDSIRVGTVLTQPEVEVRVDVNKMVSRHLAILAMTGAGKSNTTTVIIDQLLAKKGTLLVFDMHSEYGSIDFSNGKKKTIAPKINPKDLTIGEFKSLMHIGENAVNQEKYLHDAYNHARSKVVDGHKINFIKEMEDYISDLAIRIEDENKKHYESIKQVEFKLDSLAKRYYKLFDSNDEADIVELITPGRVNIISLGSVDERSVDIIVKHTLTKILRQRKSGELKVPVFCIIEEAHMIVSERRSTESKYIISKIAREGRKFGVGLCLVSQSPKSLDSETLSQVNNLIILRLVEPNDQKHVQNSSESLSSDLLKQLPSLNIGEAILLGQMTNIPTMVKIDEFEGKVVGTDLDILKEWQNSVVEEEEEEDSQFDFIDDIGI